MEAYRVYTFFKLQIAFGIFLDPDFKQVFIDLPFFCTVLSYDKEAKGVSFFE